MENFDAAQRKPGRKPIHASPAARAAAYRARKAERIAAALAQRAELDTTAVATLQKQLAVIEEQLRLTQYALSTEHDRERAKAHKVKTAASPAEGRGAVARMTILQRHFVDGPSPRVDDAKRLRINIKKAVGAAAEILGTLKTVDYDARQAVADDIEALTSAIQWLAIYSDLMETIQRGAETKKDHKTQAFAQTQEQKVRSLIAELFPNPSMMSRDVTKMATELLVYENEGKTWLAAKRRADGAHLSIEKGQDLRRALQKSDITRLARLITEEKLAMPGRGRLFTGEDQKSTWMGCWADFEEWRSTLVPDPSE